MVEHAWECHTVCRANNPQSGWCTDAPQASQALGAGKSQTGLGPSDVSLWLYLHSWLCQISLASRNQDGRAPMKVPGSLS